MIAVERHKNATPVNLYVKPQLALIFPYLQGDQIENGAIMSLRSKSFEQMFKSQSYERLVTLERSGPSPSPARHRMKSEKSLNQLFGHVTDTATGLDDTENVEADDIDVKFLRGRDRASRHKQITVLDLLFSCINTKLDQLFIVRYSFTCDVAQ